MGPRQAAVLQTQPHGTRSEAFSLSDGEDGNVLLFSIRPPGGSDGRSDRPAEAQCVWGGRRQSLNWCHTHQVQ